MIITREHHAFEGRALAAISSIRRRGVLFVLVALPDGSRSLIPAKWTDWNAEPTTRTPLDDADDSSHDLARLSDLLHLRKIIDALYSRHVDWRCARRAVMQLNSIFLDEPDLPLSQSLAVGLTTAWDQLDGASRLVALEILTRLIARMLSAQSTKEANDE